ncbi:MAG: GTPase HflX [Alphaproteobacteria bacterium]|nr:GTPase HflX [Alphaproteobacteria bacterium]
MTRTFEDTRPTSGRAAVIHPNLRRGAASASLRPAEARLGEAVALAHAIALEVRVAEIVNLHEPRPATLLGSGSVERLAKAITDAAIQVVVVDSPLSPVQQRNLEKTWQCKVIDRTGLILEIFGARARTREGKMQVELAALSYQKSRLVRSWTHLERQRGGFGFLGGPGERQIESDRRIITDRITRLKADLETVRRTRDLHRASRKRVPYSVVALAGYTNAGKSTLFNRLTKASVRAEDMLFATLDPTMRSLPLPDGQQAILSDTVGFVSDLPTDLVAAFRATLEEVVEADLIVHVRDIAHAESEAQRADVVGILEGIGVSDDTPIIEVWNKADLLSAEERERLANVTAREARVIPASAQTGEGCAALLALIATELQKRRALHTFEIDIADGASIAWLYAHGEVVDRRDDEHQMHVSARLSDVDAAKLRARLVRRLPLAAD